MPDRVRVRGRFARRRDGRPGCSSDRLRQGGGPGYPRAGADSTRHSGAGQRDTAHPQCRGPLLRDAGDHRNPVSARNQYPSRHGRKPAIAPARMAVSACAGTNRQRGAGMRGGAPRSRAAWHRAGRQGQGRAERNPPGRDRWSYERSLAWPARVGCIDPDHRHRGPPQLGQGSGQPDPALVLIGGGELRDELQQCADAEGLANSVYFPGDRDDVPALLQGMDLFALSSISEGYSMALLEACAAALPIVATDVGGNGEIVRDGLTGSLVPARDPSALAGALAALLREPAQAQTLGHAARAWVEGHGSLEGMAAGYAEIYGGQTA